MNIVAQVFALIAAAVHILAFVWESVLFRRPGVHSILKTSTANVPVVQMWSFNMGFRNLFLAVGIIVGLILLRTGPVMAGQTLVIYTSIYMALAGITMAISDGLGYYPAKGDSLVGTVSAATPPLIAVVATAW